MFKNAIVRTPCSRIVEGISTSGLGLPDYELALSQHASYVEALKDCGVAVKILNPDEDYPDSTFVEDTAVLTEKCAIITNPGADSRKGEEGRVTEALKDYYDTFAFIKSPGTLEGGDVMRVGDHFYVGLSARTNEEGTRQFLAILEKYGYSGEAVTLEKVLHLKTGLSYLEHNNLLVAGEFLEFEAFKNFNIIEVKEEESYSANCIWVNDFVIMPKGYENVKKKVVAAGYKIKVLDVSEFRKIDGGLSCLSLRF